MQQASSLAKTIFFGWKVVATAFVVATCTFGFGYYGPSIFLDVLHRQHGWPVSLISAAITAHFLVSALLVSWLPDAHSRFGIAPVTQAGVAALVTGMLGWSLADAPWQLFAATLLSGAGWAATSGAAIIAMVSPWFDQRRALALGHALNGASAGGILFAPLWISVISSLGFVQAVCIVGLLTLAIVCPLIWRYLAPTPESTGLAPDGNPVRRQPSDKPSPAPFGTLARNRQLTTLSAAFACGMFAQVGVTAHLVLRVAPLLGPYYAAGAVSLATACAVAGRVLLGIVLGQADRRVVAAGNFVMQACGVSLLAFGSTLTLLLPGCILFGLGVGNLLPLPPLIAQREFSSTDVPRVVAMVTAVNQAVFAFAPAVLGVLREISGNYLLPFLVAAAVQVVASAIIIMGRTPRVATSSPL
jgi:MFS family permease